MTKGLLTEKQAAAYLGMSQSWLSKTRMAGNPKRPPYIKMGKSVRYDSNDLDDWLMNNKRWGTDLDG